MPDRDSNLPESKRTRILLLTLLLIIIAIIYLIHFFNMQIIHGVQYKELATHVSQRSNTITAKRGEIFDRDHDVPLVLNIDSFQLNFNPAEATVNQIPVIFSKLAPLLHMTYEDLDKKIPSNLYNSYLNIELKRGVEFEIISKIAEHINEYPGVSWESNPIRSYVDNGSLSHVIGYVGNINQDELQVLYNQGYNQKSVIGKSGIEKRYDQSLRGKDGTRFRTVDVIGRNVETNTPSEIPPESGKDLVLTIDRRIQRLSEKSLGNRMGSVVVLKPSTGEILAMVSYPFYDANKFFTDEASKEFNRLQTDPTFPFVNRAIQSTYPPGSTFKIIMTTAILGEKVFDPNRIINCTGTFELGDHLFKDNKITGHGPVDLAGALAQSCNVYFWTTGLKYLEVDRIVEYAKKFGLGQTTGIDLPNETAGLVPTPQWKQKNLNYPWLGGDTVNMSIGQGNLLVTPLQMANVVALVVNKGKIYRPYLVKSLHNSMNGQVTEETQPSILFESSLPSETWVQIQNDMRGVITVGTAGVVVTTKAVKIAGKTGTAEDGAKGSSNHSWFVAYAPWGSDAKPEDAIVVCVQVEKTNEWEWWAPKAANMIFHGIFKKETYEEVVKDLNPWYLK